MSSKANSSRKMKLGTRKRRENGLPSTKLSESIESVSKPPDFKKPKNVRKQLPRKKSTVPGIHESLTDGAADNQNIKSQLSPPKVLKVILKKVATPPHHRQSVSSAVDTDKSSSLLTDDESPDIREALRKLKTLPRRQKRQLFDTNNTDYPKLSLLPRARQCARAWCTSTPMHGACSEDANFVQAAQISPILVHTSSREEHNTSAARRELTFTEGEKDVAFSVSSDSNGHGNSKEVDEILKLENVENEQEEPCHNQQSTSNCLRKLVASENDKKIHIIENRVIQRGKEKSIDNENENSEPLSSLSSSNFSHSVIEGVAQSLKLLQSVDKVIRSSSNLGRNNMFDNLTVYDDESKRRKRRSQVEKKFKTTALAARGSVNKRRRITKDISMQTEDSQRANKNNKGFDMRNISVQTELNVTDERIQKLEETVCNMSANSDSSSVQELTQISLNSVENRAGRNMKNLSVQTLRNLSVKRSTGVKNSSKRRLTRNNATQTLNILLRKTRNNHKLSLINSERGLKNISTQTFANLSVDRLYEFEDEPKKQRKTVNNAHMCMQTPRNVFDFENRMEENTRQKQKINTSKDFANLTLNNVREFETRLQRQSQPLDDRRLTKNISLQTSKWLLDLPSIKHLGQEDADRAEEALKRKCASVSMKNQSPLQVFRSTVLTPPVLFRDRRSNVINKTVHEVQDVEDFPLREQDVPLQINKDHTGRKISGQRKSTKNWPLEGEVSQTGENVLAAVPLEENVEMNVTSGRVLPEKDTDTVEGRERRISTRKISKKNDGAEKASFTENENLSLNKNSSEVIPVERAPLEEIGQNVEMDVTTGRVLPEKDPDTVQGIERRISTRKISKKNDDAEKLDGRTENDVPDNFNSAIINVSNLAGGVREEEGKKKVSVSKGVKRKGKRKAESKENCADTMDNISNNDGLRRSGRKRKPPTPYASTVVLLATSADLRFYGTNMYTLKNSTGRNGFSLDSEHSLSTNITRKSRTKPKNSKCVGEPQAGSSLLPPIPEADFGPVSEGKFPRRETVGTAQHVDAVVHLNKPFNLADESGISICINNIKIWLERGEVTELPHVEKSRYIYASKGSVELLGQSRKFVLSDSEECVLPIGEKYNVKNVSKDTSLIQVMCLK